MFCNNCGKELNQGTSFCPNCGNKINPNINNNINNNMNVNMNVNTMTNPVNNMNYNVNNGVNNNVNNSKKKNNVPLIIALSGIVVVLVFVFIFLSFSPDKKAKDDVVSSRTIMIYLCGSDLESRIGLATSDLKSINVEKIDLDTTNVVVYTGGAKKWFNYVENDENAIYVLEEDGFVKKKTYNKQSMGSSNSLSTLFDYAYDNYEADKYDLIMWNHGLGALGISSDELFMADYLSLNELTEALKKSEFKGDNKLETVVFRSCLNSTLEMASVFVPYANYFVASEEVTWGGYMGKGVFDFINDVTLEDTGIDFGKKFISNYEASLDYLAQRSGDTLDEMFPVSTYAILDLSKIDELENKLGTFFKSVNLDLNYNTVSRVRSNLYQYASESGCDDYDTVDLYQLIQGLKTLSSSKAEEVLNLLDDAIVYNWSNNSFSKGLAIYFPYRSGSNARRIHYNGYKNLNGLNDYYEFIQRFDSLQSSSSNGGFSAISKDDIKISINNKKLSLNLYDEDVDNFTKASYMIFKKESDGRYTPVFTSDTFELAKSSYTMDLNMYLIKATSLDHNYSQIINVNVNRFNKYYADSELRDESGNYNAKVYFNVGDDVTISKVIESSTESSSGMFLNIDDFSSMTFTTGAYQMYRNGEIDSTWDKNPWTPSRIVLENNYKFEKVELDDSYYVMFKIYDVDNLYTYSDLIQVK